MIQNFNKFSQSKIAKLFLIMVALSFGAFWGGSGFFTPKDPNRYVAQVGERQIDRGQFRSVLEQNMEAVSQSAGRKLTPLDAVESGLADEVLQSLINQELLELEAESMGLQVTDAEVLEMIHSMPVFKDEAGTFSRDKFNRIVAANRMHEAEFVEMIKTNIKRQQILSAVGAGAYSPLSLVEGVLKATHQIRQGATLKVDVNSMPSPAAASDQELEEFYNEHKEVFKLPETRSFTMVSISPDRFVTPEQLNDAAINEEYELIKQDLGDKPLSEVKNQVKDALKKKLSADGMYEITQKLEDEIASGTSIEEVAKANGLQLQSFEAATVDGTKADGNENIKPVLAAAVMPQVFSTEEGEESIFFELQADGSYAVVRTDKVIPENIPAFDAAKPDVEKLWVKLKKNDAAIERVKEIVQNINEKNELPGAMTLLPNVSLSGKNQDIRPEVMDVLYQLAPGKATAIPVDNGYMVVMLKKIIPSQSIKSKESEGEKAVEEQMKLDLAKSFINSLKVKYQVSINRDALRNALGL